MAVIREQRQFGLSPVRVVRAETGGQAVGQALAQAGETFSDIMFRRASVQAEKAGKEAALSVEAEKVITFDPVTQKPVALTPPKPFGTIAAEAYQNIINQRFNQEIESDIKLRGTELAIQFKNSANGSELYKQAMNDYVDQLKENAGGMYGEYISGIGNDYTEMTYLNLKENEQARARAQQIAAMNDSNADVIAQVQAAAAQVGAAQAAQMFPETALSLGARAGLTDSSSDSRVREAYRIALAQGGAEYAFNQAVNSGKYTREELQLARSFISTNSGFHSINIPELKEALAPFVSNYDDWVSVTSPLLDTFNNLIVQKDTRIQLENMAVVSRSTTRPIDLGLDPSGYFTDPQSSIGMVTDAAKSWKAISDQFNRAGAWERSNPKILARYDAAQRNYAEAIDASIDAYTAALPAGTDGIEEIVKLQSAIRMGGRGKEDLSEASRTLLSQMEAVDGATGLQDFETSLISALDTSKTLIAQQQEIDNSNQAKAEQLERAGFGREYDDALNRVTGSIKSAADAELLIEALRTKNTENLPSTFQQFAEDIIKLGQRSGSDEYIKLADEYVNSLRTIFEATEQRRQFEQGKQEAAKALAVAQTQAKNRNLARTIAQETRAEIFNANSIEEVEALRKSAIDGLNSLLEGEEDNAFIIGLKNKIEDVTAEVYVRSILTTAKTRGDFMTLMYALGGDEEALKTLKDDPRLEQIKKARVYGSADTDSYSSSLNRISRDLLEQANTVEAQLEYQRRADIILSGFGNPASAEDQRIAEEVLGADFTDKLIGGRVGPEELNAARNAPPTGLINSFNTFQNQPIERQLQLLSAYSQFGFIESQGQLIPSRGSTALDPSAKAYMEGLQDFIESSGAKTREDILFQAEQFRQVRGPDAVEAVNNYYKSNDLELDGKTYGTISEFIRSRFYQHSLNPRTIQYLEDRFYMSAASHIITGRDLDLNKWSKDMDNWIDKDIVYDPRVWDGGVWPADFDASGLTARMVEIPFVPTAGLGMATVVTTATARENLSRQQWAKTEFSLVKELGGTEAADRFIDYVTSAVGHNLWVLRPASTVSTDGGVVYEVLDVTSGRPNRAIARSGGRNEPELISEPIYVSTREAAFIGLEKAADRTDQRQQAAEMLNAPVTPQDQNIFQRGASKIGAFIRGQSLADEALSESISAFGNTFSSQIESVGVGDRSVARSLTSGNIGSLDRYRIRLERALTTAQEGTPRYNDIQNLLREIQRINELHGR